MLRKCALRVLLLFLRNDASAALDQLAPRLPARAAARHFDVRVVAYALHLRHVRLRSDVELPVVPQPGPDRRRHRLAAPLVRDEEGVLRAAELVEGAGLSSFTRDTRRRRAADAIEKAVPGTAHTGITPCFLFGRSTCLLAAISSARATTARVSRGSMMSSIMALPAAM